MLITYTQLRKIAFCVILLTVLPTHGFAKGFISKGDFARLPPYCKGTQSNRDVSGDPTPLEEYVKRFGPDFMNLHHYCWALDKENKSDISIRTNYGYLNQAVGDIDYVIKYNRNRRFFLLPEIYTSKARILFKLKKDKEAEESLLEAIALRPSYTPAVARLVDSYVANGKVEDAIRILTKGIANSPKSSMLNNKLKELLNQQNPDATR